MSVNPGNESRSYSDDLYRDVYDTTILHTLNESVSSPFKARAWSLLTAIWSAVASPINIIRHLGAAILLGSYNLARGDVEHAKSEFSTHSYRALDSLGKFVGGTTLGACGILIPEMAALVNYKFNETMRKMLGVDGVPILVTPGLEKEIHKSLEEYVKSPESEATPKDIYTAYLSPDPQNEEASESDIKKRIALLKRIIPETKILDWINLRKMSLSFENRKNEDELIKAEYRTLILDQLKLEASKDPDFIGKLLNRPNQLSCEIFFIFRDQKLFNFDENQRLAELFAKDPAILAWLNSHHPPQNPS